MVYNNPPPFDHAAPLEAAPELEDVSTHVGEAALVVAQAARERRWPSGDSVKGYAGHFVVSFWKHSSNPTG